DAVRFHDRFISTRPEDSQFDNRTYQRAATEYLGKLPDHQFRDAARNAVAQAPPQERAGLLDGILSAMSGSTGGATAGAGGLAAIASMLGLGSTDPKKISEDDARRGINLERQAHME